MLFDKKDRTFSKTNRLRKVIQILLKYGFEDVVTRTALQRFVSTKIRTTWMRQDRPVFEYSVWERLRMVIEELGPTFVKLAQVLSNRPDILPKGLIVEFEKLQDSVPPFDFKLARSNIERATGKRIDEVFAYFDDRPLGSASIGQVHRARLITGEDVVVKVQRPGARKQVLTDLRLLKDFVRRTENYFKRNGILNPMDIVETFEKSMQAELDYKTEAANIQKFRNIYKNEKRMHVPVPYPHLTSSRVLVMEYVSGCKITDIKQLKEWGLDPKKVAKNGLAIYLKQMFEVGFFHADPHPGNVLVKPNGQIILIDYGMVGKLMKQQKFAFANLFVSLAQQDARGMAIYLKRLGKESGDSDDLRAIEFDLAELIEEFVTFGDENTSMADITGKLQQIIYDYQLSVPGSIFLILRSLAILEGINNVLHPEFDILGYIKPYGTEILKEQYSLRNLSTDVYYSFSQISSLVYNLPIELKYILRKVRTGKMQLNIEHKGYEKILDEFDFAINKLTLTGLTSASLIASSISLSAPMPPSMATDGGIPYISLIGFSLSGAFGVALIIYMIGGNHPKH